MFIKAARVLGCLRPFLVRTAGLCTIRRSKEEDITAFVGTFFLVWKKYDFHSLVSGVCSWGPMKEVHVLLLEDLQRCADRSTVTTALGPGILLFPMQSEARGSPGHWVWWWVCPPSLGVADLLGLPQDSPRGQQLLPALSSWSS